MGHSIFFKKKSSGTICMTYERRSFGGIQTSDQVHSILVLINWFDEIFGILVIRKDWSHKFKTYKIGFLLVIFIFKEEKKSLKERLQTIQEVTQSVQNSIGFIASLGEQIKKLVHDFIFFLFFVLFFHFDLLYFRFQHF